MDAPVRIGAAGGARTASLDPLIDPSLTPLFWHAERVGEVSAWWTHVPFAFWLVNQAKPRVFVELGTQNGVSYSAFCQAVRLGQLSTSCFAVDTWRGDPHAGESSEEVYEEFRRFHDDRFAAFSTLLQCTFDEALTVMADGAVDLLHLDGLHTYESVRHDFDSWRSKLSDRAVVLFHDTNERRSDFGVWRLWGELGRLYPSFEFLHGHGLGVLAVGHNAPRAVIDLCSLLDPEAIAIVRERFGALGYRWSSESELRQARADARRLAEAGHIAEQARLEGDRARQQLEQAVADRDTLAEAIAFTEHRLEAADAEAAAVRALASATAVRMAAIERSTVWRATRPLRDMLERFPRIRRVGRRAVHVGWWTIKRQLSQRLRERRALLARSRTLEASPLFDRDWYLGQYPDVAVAQLDPALHYLTHGAAEGRSPGPDFDSAFYLATNPDVAGENPLLHYISRGKAEGRPTRAARAHERHVSYDQWVRDYDSLDDLDRAAIREHIAALQWPVQISVVVPAYNTNQQYLREMIESVRRQLYPHWELCIADDASTERHVKQVLHEFEALDSRIKVITRQTNGHVSAATNSALDLASGEFVALLDHDDRLPEHALYEVAVELNAHPDADVIYSDSDVIDDAGQRSLPYFKTDWDPDLMLGHNMVCHLGVYRRSLLEDIGRLRVGFEGSQDYDLMLRAAAASTPTRIRHLPAFLYHWRRAGRSPSFSEASLERCVDAARRAIRDHLDQAGIRARVEPSPGTSYNRIVYPLPGQRPLVSIIVPTRDRGDLLADCVNRVLTQTDYEPLEIIVVDNESQEPETLRLFSRLAVDPRVRIIPYTGGFNYAAMNNMAVREARGEVVVLLNNDVKVISAAWLTEMVSHALRPEVGAVGARLLHADGRIQHGGVVMGGDHCAGHLFQHLPREHPGPFGLLTLTRRVSAVTAACMALRRSVYLGAGGMDEVNLRVAYNDVDLCLRLGEQGYSVIWTPHAELYHLESATRGSDKHGESAARLMHEARYLRRRWPSVIDCDPHYNPNCSLVCAEFRPACPPRRAKPWLTFRNALEAAAPAPTREAPAASREATLLSTLDRSKRIIEIGPSYNPIASKSGGWNTKTIDHTTRDELVESREQADFADPPSKATPPPAVHAGRPDISSAATARLPQYVAGPPSGQAVLDLFDGEWASQLPSDCGWRPRAGSAALFEDPRITWLSGQIHGFGGRSVLELGPLEGGHSYMLQHGGAERIVSIEANVRAFLRCLCVKELFALDRVRFLLGDFVDYLESSNERFDLTLASGVLYHMQEPAEFLKLVAKSAPTLMVWTHFYDHQAIQARPELRRKFGPLHSGALDGLTYESAEYRYLEALESPKFCGGLRPTSRWMTKQSILDVLERLGFSSMVTAFEELEHPNGPAFALVARR